MAGFSMTACEGARLSSGAWLGKNFRPSLLHLWSWMIIRCPYVCFLQRPLTQVDVLTCDSVQLAIGWPHFESLKYYVRRAWDIEMVFVNTFDLYNTFSSY